MKRLMTKGSLTGLLAVLLIAAMPSFARADHWHGGGWGHGGWEHRGWGHGHWGFSLGLGWPSYSYYWGPSYYYAPPVYWSAPVYSYSYAPVYAYPAPYVYRPVYRPYYYSYPSYGGFYGRVTFHYH